MKLSIACCLAATVALTAACKDNAANDGSDTTAMGEIATSATPDTMASPAAPSLSGKEFADRVAASDAYEIAAARLALAKSRNKDIRHFADTMIEDHGKSSADLATAASAAGLAAPAGPQPNAEQKALLDALEKAGPDFDRIYVDQQRMAHDQSLTMLRGYSGNGDVESLRDFAGDTADTVEGHLEMLKDMAEDAAEQGNKPS